VTVRLSPIQGRGLFATQTIPEGQVVIRWGGTLFSLSDVAAGKARLESLAHVEEGIYIGGLCGAAGLDDEFMNHSCDPNIWLVDALTWVTRRSIDAGEELLADYALFESDPVWSMPCGCGSPLCRRYIDGHGWRLPELQARYRGHFSPYLERRIQVLRLTSPVQHG
jgi:hypothetical protein